ncbi:MAG TPA: hypothetical protein VFS20_01705 [Longimicrobium sp.]|nr:hypothetical protein [Longimicrobium sp.]
MSTYTNPVHLARAAFLVTAGGIMLAGALGPGRDGELPAMHVGGAALVAAIFFSFAAHSVYAWRRARAVRAARAPALQAGAADAGVRARWRFDSVEEGRQLTAAQPRLDNVGPLLAMGVLSVAAAAMPGWPHAGLRVWLGAPVAAAAVAFVIWLLFRRQLRFDATTVGDPTEVVLAPDALLLAGRFHWLQDPNERLVGAHVEDWGPEQGPVLVLSVATYGRFGPRVTPIWLPLLPERVDEIRQIAAELSASVPPRLARLAPVPAYAA